MKQSSQLVGSCFKEIDEMKDQNKKAEKQIYNRDLNCVAESGKMDPFRSTSQITFFLNSCRSH